MSVQLAKMIWVGEGRGLGSWREITRPKPGREDLRGKDLDTVIGAPRLLVQSDDECIPLGSAARGGGRVARRGGIYFTSIEAARNLLTANRLAVRQALVEPLID